MCMCHDVIVIQPKRIGASVESNWYVVVGSTPQIHGNATVDVVVSELVGSSKLEECHNCMPTFRYTWWHPKAMQSIIIIGVNC